MICGLPAHRLHWYFNDECERSVMLAVLNPPEDIPAAFAVRRTSWQQRHILSPQGLALTWPAS